MPYLEGAIVVIDNASGGIRALVGDGIMGKANSIGRWLRQTGK